MNNPVRELFWSKEFDTYYQSLAPNIKEKFDYVMTIMRTQRVVNSKFVKILENTEFYEMRVSVGNNEYRSIVFTIDSRSFVECRNVILLNVFQKKSTKQYKGEIQIARNIIKKMEV